MTETRRLRQLQHHLTSKTCNLMPGSDVVRRHLLEVGVVGPHHLSAQPYKRCVFASAASVEKDCLQSSRVRARRTEMAVVASFDIHGGAVGPPKFATLFRLRTRETRVSVESKAIAGDRREGNFRSRRRTLEAESRRSEHSASFRVSDAAESELHIPRRRYVRRGERADALRRVLPTEKSECNTRLTACVIVSVAAKQTGHAHRKGAPQREWTRRGDKVQHSLGPKPRCSRRNDKRAGSHGALCRRQVRARNGYGVTCIC